MSALKFKVGEPQAVTLAFDQPKTGTNQYGAWYLYGIKNGNLDSDEDGFFATASLHAMIKTLGAGEGDEIVIEKCLEGDRFFFKVNGLTMQDMNSGGSAEKIEKAKPKMSYDELLDKYNHIMEIIRKLMLVIWIRYIDKK